MSIQWLWQVEIGIRIVEEHVCLLTESKVCDCLAHAAEPDDSQLHSLQALAVKKVRVQFVDETSREDGASNL